MGRDYVMGTHCKHGSVAAELDAPIGKVLAGNSWQTSPRSEWELALRGQCVLAFMFVHMFYVNPCSIFSNVLFNGNI